MTPDQAVAHLDRLLEEAPPEPEALWEVFKEWTRRPVDCERDEVSVSVGYRAGRAWIEFRRTWEDFRLEQEEFVTLCLSSSRPDAPHLAEAVERCAEAGELAAFFARVERLPGFTLALRYPHWQYQAEVD
jgi:hypothetical protein